MLTTIIQPKKLKTLKPPVLSFESQQHQEFSIENHIWVTARKIEIAVRSMAISHINNCIACFEGRGNMRIPEDYLGGKEKWLKIFNEELTKRQ